MDIETYAQSTWQFYQRQMPTNLDLLLKLLKPESILDCGCGDGSLLSVLVKHPSLQKRTIQAIDLSVARIKLVKKISPRIRARVDNAEVLAKIKTASCDLVIATQIIEHVDDQAMIRALQRVLKKKGIAYVTTVFKKYWAWYFYQNSSRQWVLDPTHQREYINENDLLKLFSNNQFEIIAASKKNLTYPWTDLLFKLFKINNRQIYKNNVLNFLRNLTIKIPGYYNWEIIVRKK
jgi:2-polyprenyl-3-methyl-5-hydroxy-6-metoxy-1,4-benzoquinol methylase